ncbi:hypothetical protein GGU10DRAFT_382592 [Lentinula aff. detonsa]|uniref:G-patch domain-containing protein n=1 Tax=Lentinula aff. detonsa TaxID=2804958 RepID=A0AA38NU38_9AGAR|nr:hypothetical protein GGU10DRAFT_382592 [Lentinula aff. detonsa]
MPLDGHSYLVAQGWSGKGNGLRKGAIAKPITVNQKKTLAGLGKDRDEAFPFWDHLFSAASQAITVKIDDSDASDTDEIHSSVAPVLRRTTTGILSNRRPVDVVPALNSGASTPDSSSSELRMSLIAMAKREAAKRNLYSRFYRGAVLAPEVEVGIHELTGSAGSISTTPSVAPSPFETLSNNPNPKGKGKGKGKEEHRDVDSKKEKKRKIEEPEHDEDVDKIENKTERRERKRRKKEVKEMEAQMKEIPSEVRLKEKEKKKRHGKLKDLLDDRSFPEVSSPVPNAKDVLLQNHEEKRRRKKEKERIKQQSKTEQKNLK